jgi:hypothetical protein
VKLKWMRRSPTSTNNFDLVLMNPEELDSARVERLLNAIMEESHRGLTLSGRASKEFRRWLRQPGTPLKSEAYVLLSNWFMTRSGDRNSMVASCCEALWDELFPCRPLQRLSSPAPGENHAIIGSEFESLWQCILKAQAGAEVPLPSDTTLSAPVLADMPEHQLPSPTINLPEDGSNHFGEAPLKAIFVKDGVRFEVAGSPRALAEFLRTYGQSYAITGGSK